MRRWFPALPIGVLTVVAGTVSPQTRSPSPAMQRKASERSTAYGQGSQLRIDYGPDGNVSEVRELDPGGRTREATVYAYGPGTKQMAAKRRRYFARSGSLETLVEEHWAADGRQTDYSSVRHAPDGAEVGGVKIQFADPKIGTPAIHQNWDPQSEHWVEQPLPKTPSALSALAAPPSGSAPVTAQVGIIIARDYHAGDTISGSLLPANVASAYSGVPGLSVRTFTIQLPGEPNGFANFSGIEIGAEGHGYSPVEDGSFTLHLPMDHKGALQLQVRQQDAPPGSAASYVVLQIDTSVDAPALPQDFVNFRTAQWFTSQDTGYLAYLWNYAFDIEQDLDDAGRHGASDEQMRWLADELGYAYDEIEIDAANLPEELVAKLARRLADGTRATALEIRREARQGLTEDQKTQLDEYRDWANFLDAEAENRANYAVANSIREWSPFWISPVLTQGKLAALRGPFSGDDDSKQIHLDNVSISPLAETPNCYYFRPPERLPAGPHTIEIETPGTPVITLSFLYLWLETWADQTTLRKGQTATYHVKLSGVNGLSPHFWSSASFPRDLIGPSELDGPPPQWNQQGAITLTVTNDTPDAISMQNVSRVLDAQSFAESGTFQLDVPLQASRDGGFNVSSVAQAYLRPQWGWGNEVFFPVWSGAPNPFKDLPPRSDAALAPGVDSCNLLNGLAPRDPLYPGDLFNFCMGYEAGEILNSFFQISHPDPVISAPMNQLDPQLREALRPGGLRQTQFRVTSAQQMALDLKGRCDHESKKESVAWNAAIANVSVSLIDALAKAARDDFKAGMAERNARDLCALNPSVSNKIKLQDASMVSANAHAAFETAQSAVTDQFPPERRAVWEAAKSDLKAAEFYLAQAEEELRDARITMGQFQPLDLNYLF